MGVLESAGKVLDFFVSKQVGTPNHYVMTNKEYLIKSHILLEYFELVFLQVQLVKISCKLMSLK